MVDNLKKLIDLYGNEISTDIPEDIYDYVYLNLKRIRKYREQFNIPIIGITGKHGKTITKKMLSTILSTKGKVLETPLYSRTATNVTSTLIQLSTDYQYAIIEFGIQYERQFKLAVDITRPTIGIVTNIGESHHAYLGNQKVVSEIKGEVIKALPKDGAAVLNYDDDMASYMGKFSHTQNVIKFGLNPNSHFSASDIEYLGSRGIRFKINTLYDAHLNIYSTSDVYNALGAIATAKILGIDIEESISVLEKNLTLPQGRGNLIKFKDFCLLDYSYDASPDSINKAARSLSSFKDFKKKLIMIVGELGDYEGKTDTYHLSAGYFLGALPIDTFITVGDKAKLIADGVKKVNGSKKDIQSASKDENNIVEILKKVLVPNSIVMITGNHIQNLGETVAQIKSSFELR